MRKELYQKRVASRICVVCRASLQPGHNFKKCHGCQVAENEYRQRTRTDKRAKQEKEYRENHWFNRCCYLSRSSDKRRNNVCKPEHFITGTRLRTLQILQLNRCFWCETIMQVENRRGGTGLTVERLNNEKPHALSNCLLCCSRCNSKRIADKQNVPIGDAYMKILDRFEKSVQYEQFLKLIDSIKL